MYTLALLEKEATCIVLHALISGNTRKYRISVIKPRSDSGMQNDRSRLKGKKRADSSNLL